MKKINCNNSKVRWNEIIDKFILDLLEDEYKNKQKLIELCHIGKFLDNLDIESEIEEISESPDFIVRYQNKLVGVELKRLTDVSEREYEGFWETIFLNAEKKIKQRKTIPNILVNCWLKSDIKYTIYNKQEYINLIIKVLEEYVITGVCMKNSIIEDIYTMPHSEISLCPNFGAWFQNYLSNEILQRFISEKDNRFLKEYRKRVKNVWLLVVIGSTNASSYQISDSILYQIKTGFDRVYLLEDFNNNLYQLK